MGNAVNFFHSANTKSMSPIDGFINNDKTIIKR